MERAQHSIEHRRSRGRWSALLALLLTATAAGATVPAAVPAQPLAAPALPPTEDFTRPADIAAAPPAMSAPHRRIGLGDAVGTTLADAMFQIEIAVGFAVLVAAVFVRRRHRARVGWGVLPDRRGSAWEWGGRIEG